MDYEEIKSAIEKIRNGIESHVEHRWTIIGILESLNERLYELEINAPVAGHGPKRDGQDDCYHQIRHSE